MANLLKIFQTFYENSTFLILIEKKNMNFKNKDQNQLLDSEYKYRS